MYWTFLGRQYLMPSYVHGISYVDERLMMMDHTENGPASPYYYSIDRMYNVRVLVDRAGSIVERYCYDPYGRPLIRESCGRGKLRINDWMNSTDLATMSSAVDGTIWDVRGDMDDDGDVDEDDWDLFLVKYPTWQISAAPTVAQAFSDVGNPFMFQGRVHFALDTEADATEGELLLNDHRNRFSDVVTGRWVTRDPLVYNPDILMQVDYEQDTCYESISCKPSASPLEYAHRELSNLAETKVSQYNSFLNSPTSQHDPSGLQTLVASPALCCYQYSCLLTLSMPTGGFWNPGVSCTYTCTFNGVILGGSASPFLSGGAFFGTVFFCPGPGKPGFPGWITSETNVLRSWLSPFGTPPICPPTTTTWRCRAQAPWGAWL